MHLQLPNIAFNMFPVLLSNLILKLQCEISAVLLAMNLIIAHITHEIKRMTRVVHQQTV